MLLFRLIPILVNGMKYSEIDIILLKVRYELHTGSDCYGCRLLQMLMQKFAIFIGLKHTYSCTNSH